MHCWPSLNQSLSEIFRVLKPHGVFYASTFFVNEIKNIRRKNDSSSSSFFKKNNNFNQQGFIYIYLFLFIIK
jgi:ubiquinone/menaquinone biosynthesis C-methylase UbiE